AGQEENSFAIAFDPAITPVRFEIPNLASWRLADAAPENGGLRRLEFELTQPVRDRLTVKLIGEGLIDDLTGSHRFPALSASALRVEQTRNLLTTADLTLSPQPGSRHRQSDFRPGDVDTAGFRPAGTFAISGEDEPLNFTLTTQTPERQVVADYVFQVGSGKLETIGQFQIRSPGSPLLNLTVTLPAGASVQAVGGNRVKDWWRDGDSLFVRFSGDTPEVTALLVYVAHPIADESAPVAIAPFGLPEFPKPESVTGTGLVVAHVTRDATLQFDQDRRTVREVGVEEIGRDFEVLAPLERKRGFRFDRAGFTGSVTMTDIAPRFDASWVMLAQAHESWLRLSIQTDIAITRSAIDRIRFATDESVPELRIHSPEVREVRTETADGRRTYTVVFQHHVTDAIAFTLETEIPHAGTGALPDIDFPGATRLERFIIVENQSQDRMEVHPDGLDPTVRELFPFVPDTLNSAQWFRARPGWELSVSMEKLATSSGNDAVVLYADLSTAFRSNGEEWLKAVYHLQNRSLQFLPIALPTEAELVSVTVAGHEVRADRGEIAGKAVALVPLIQTKPGQLAYDVSLVLRRRDSISPAAEPLRSLERKLDDPEIVGLTIERTLWNVYLPAGHELRDAEGNMVRVENQENELQKLQADLSELEILNGLAQANRSDYETANLALSNGGVIATKIERQIEQITRLNRSAGSEEQTLRSKLAEQKAILDKNRERLPAIQQQSMDQYHANGGTINIGGGFQGKDVTWDVNNSEVELRNTNIDAKGRDQLERIQSQVRLNDNVSIGNQWFNAKTRAEGEIVEVDKQMADLQAVAANQAPVSELKQQVAKFALAGDDSGAALGSKLKQLEEAQVGQAGAAGNLGGPAAATSKPDTAQSDFIDLKSDADMPIASERLAEVRKSESDGAEVGKKGAAVKRGRAYFGDNARQQLSSSLSTNLAVIDESAPQTPVNPEPQSRGLRSGNQPISG
ncbi:MAG: hypothetical protein KDM63_11935, partial [Verrucomicrobiae bacterium]|nr:hypothetical protein [Verrucomicrobiae bacterium]